MLLAREQLEALQQLARRGLQTSVRTACYKLAAFT